MLRLVLLIRMGRPCSDRDNGTANSISYTYSRCASWSRQVQYVLGEERAKGDLDTFRMLIYAIRKVTLLIAGDLSDRKPPERAKVNYLW